MKRISDWSFWVSVVCVAINIAVLFIQAELGNKAAAQEALWWAGLCGASAIILWVYDRK